MQLHTYGSHLNQWKKNPWQNTWKKNHGSHLVYTRGGHLVFQNQPKKIPWQVFPMMNLSCKFGSSSYNILRDGKAFVKTWWTDARTDRGHFIISRTGPIGRREIIRPILEYGDVVWQEASQSDLCKLDSIQSAEWTMSLVSGAPYRSNIQSLYIELGWQNLQERR